MLRSERRTPPALPAPVVTEVAAEPAPQQPLQDSPRARSPAPAPGLMLSVKVHADEEAVQRPEHFGGSVESSDSEAEDAAAQVTRCACRSGLPSACRPDQGTTSGIWDTQ